ncbi:hypothetical protein [Protaetiibacter intestinalis]|uniref:Uncharacterized protein n=1 Tax=Protaetiibacter intestinalis TaxID=2419774 RepID=A0A387B359_9MICO|nr:hypothetical protein [Protaetiibacter intestinalis]AYF96843.1 hypothetical protein D7I47_00300 [Protaetiibacter intestinalis]
MDLVPLLVVALLLQTAILALQVGDAITGFIDARRVRDSDDPEVITRNSVRELTWTIAVTAISAVLIAFGVDAAARALFDLSQPFVALLVILAVALVAFGIGTIAVLAVVRRDRPTYARIRRDLRDRSIMQLEEDELAVFDARLAEADRLRVRRSAAGSTLRLVALLAVLGIGLPSAIGGFAEGLPGLAVAAIVAVALSVAAFIVAVRASVVRDAAVDAVREAQRAEVVALLERARIPQRKTVPGLRDRVTRALAILREQQK